MTIPDVSALSLEEKAALTSGESFWLTTPIERAGVPAIMLTDGPHGLRKQIGDGDHVGIGPSVPATCFPPAVALGSSWDAALVERVGAAIGAEASIEGVGVVLGPGVNIKRSPLCGRNFEYFSEDPVVSGVLGAALVTGIQSQGVGASVKHFAANNQEDDRMRSSSDVDPRPLHEIYLRAFRRIVRDARPWTVMGSYNRINGVYVSEDPVLLTRVLRDAWGFDGLVVSDWGAVNDRIAALVAGLDLEMPSSGGVNDARIVAAVQDGTLDEAYLDAAAGRVLDLVRRVTEGAGRVPGPLDVGAHHALAREAAARAIVLLRNERDVLPLRRDASIAVIGEFARRPRFQGAGSSLIEPTRVDSALDAMHAAGTGRVVFAEGFRTGRDAGTDVDALRAEAVAAASAADVAIVFAGLPAESESEGYDRDDIDLPADQLALIDAVAAANPDTVVVLSNGGVVALPFAHRVPAIVEGWLLGQAGGAAIADVLFGDVNPSGRLAETIPLRLEDTPAYLDFPGEFSHVRYGEGIFVGYRWYDARRMPVAFPFGHGLSYTSFAYGDAAAEVGPDGDVRVRIAVTNTGARAGREVVQAYASLPGSAVQRPVRALAAFAIVELEPGATREVELSVRRDDLAYWDRRVQREVVEGGEYAIEVGASSRDIRACTVVAVPGDELVVPLTRESSLGEVLAHPVAGPLAQAALTQMSAGLVGMRSIMPEGVDALRMMASLPIGRISLMAGPGVVTPEMIDGLLAVANAPRADA